MLISTWCDPRILMYQRDRASRVPLHLQLYGLPNRMLRFTAEISFTDLPYLPEKAPRTLTSQGVYRTLDKSLCSGVMEPRIYYESFVVPQPDGIVHEYTRDYILGKLRLLAGEVDASSLVLHGVLFTWRASA